jgi:hypothetical protein
LSIQSFTVHLLRLSAVFCIQQNAGAFAPASMTLKLTAEIVQLQQQIFARLAELGYADSLSAENIARYLAEISVLGNAFAKTTLPLFLTLDREHLEPLAQLTVSIKCDLEELADAVHDSDPDIRALMQFLNERSADQ